MEKILSLQKQLARARWLPLLVILLTLCILGGTICFSARQVRGALRVGIVNREAEVLDAVAMLESLGAESPADFSQRLSDQAGQLALALRLSKLREGVVAVRLYDAQGSFVTAMPISVRPAGLGAAEQAALGRLQPVSFYQPKADLATLFVGWPKGSAGDVQPSPLLTVMIPLHAEGSADLLAVAELVQDGSGVARAFAALDRELAAQGLVTFVLAGCILVLALSWAFQRLQTITRRLEEQAVSLRRANQELALAAKTSALGAVTAHVIHGLSSPLAGLQSFIAAHAGDGAAWQDAAHDTQRMRTLIGEIVRILGEESESTLYELPLDELSQIISSRIAPVAREAGVGFDLEFEAEGCLVNRDANLVLMILENLLRNAIEATPPGRRVRVSFRNDPTGVLCGVCDEGPGLPEAVRQNLFTPCCSTKSAGNGIGLTLSQHLARHLGAELTLADTSPAGSAFQLRLPHTLMSDAKASGHPAPNGCYEPQTRRNTMSLVPCAAKTLLALVGIAAWANAATLQAVTYPLTWRWSNPTPHGADIVDMALGSSLCVQVGERGQIFTSTDLDYWMPRDSHTTRSLRGVAFLGGRIVISGENGTILFADDPADFCLVDLGTSNWLESVAASTNRVVAVGDNGAIYTSTNGVAWTRVTTSITTWLRSVSWGPPGFVAVGENGFVASSTNASTWTVRSSTVSQHLNRVAWIGDRYYAVGDAGRTVTSVNGISWTQQSCGATNYLFAAAGTNSSVVAVGEQEVRLKESGVWTNELRATKVSPPPAWSYYSALWDGSGYRLGGSVGMWVRGVRTNSTSEVGWDVPSESVRTWLWAIKRTPYFYLAAGDRGTVMTSDNGIDWDLNLVPGTMTNTVFLGVGGTSTNFYAVGSAGAIIRSTNGITWDSVTPAPTTNDLQGFAVLGDNLLAAGARGTLLASTNGKTWTKRTTPTVNFLSSIETFPGGVVVSGDYGTILVSSDGINWASRGLATTNWFYQVRYLNGVLLIVGENGVVLTSTNGTTWASRSSGTTAWLTDAAFVDGTWFVVGFSGTVLASTNLANWTSIGTSTKQSLLGVAATGSQLVTVGVQGIILRSQVVPDRSPVVFVRYGRAADRNIFLFGGVPDQRFLLEHSPNLSAWSPGATLEFTDGTGTLIFVEDYPSVNPPEYYRARLVP